MVEKLKETNNINIKKFIYFFIRKICNYINFQIFKFRDLREIKKQYGNFESLGKKEQEKYDFKIPNVCGFYYAEIIKAITDLNFLPKRILFDGDSKLVINQFKDRFNYDSTEILTVGIGDDFDFNWNFEENPPENLPNDFDVIVSQNVFEHLIDPYKHLIDLKNKLSLGGVIIIQTHLPGFQYHRYPIDALRFFPDWFETSANRLNLSVIRKIRRDFNIFYVLKK